MSDFDKRIETECGNELYLNRKFTGITNKMPYTGNAFNKINFGTGVQEKIPYFTGNGKSRWDKENTTPETFTNTFSFGTGIGDRKISKKPDYDWNRMNSGNAPIYWGGNYYLDPANTLSNDYVNILAKDNDSNLWVDNGVSNGNIEISDEILYSNVGKCSKGGSKVSVASNKRVNNNIARYGGIDGNDKNVENFANEYDAGAKCSGCKAFKFDWVMLVLVIIFVLMIIMCCNV
jgi:hypothetical protein